MGFKRFKQIFRPSLHITEMCMFCSLNARVLQQRRKHLATLARTGAPSIAILRSPSRSRPRSLAVSRCLIDSDTRALTFSARRLRPARTPRASFQGSPRPLGGQGRGAPPRPGERRQKRQRRQSGSGTWGFGRESRRPVLASASVLKTKTIVEVDS